MPRVGKHEAHYEPDPHLGRCVVTDNNAQPGLQADGGGEVGGVRWGNRGWGWEEGHRAGDEYVTAAGRMMESTV